MAASLEIRSALHRRLHAAPQRTYLLVEFDGSGAPAAETFPAASDGEALERALEVAEGSAFEVWEGARFVRRWTMSDPDSRSFSPRWPRRV
jgi:hypothetical protein